jgi:hypothetical protein
MLARHGPSQQPRPAVLSGGPGVGLAGPGVAAGFNLKFTVKLPVSHWQQWHVPLAAVAVMVPIIVIIRVISDSPSHLRVRHVTVTSASRSVQRHWPQGPRPQPEGGDAAAT